MSSAPVSTDQAWLRQTRLIWPSSIWPANDRDGWIRARLGTGPAGRDNPAASWTQRTAEKNEDGYGGYLSWLHRTVSTPERKCIGGPE